MIKKQNNIKHYSKHRIALVVVLCFFSLCLIYAYSVPQKRAKKVDEKIYLVHADELKKTDFGPNSDAQILKGHVHLTHNGASLKCDSAYLYQETNSVRAFGHVNFKQGDTLSLVGERGYYDGQSQILEVRKNVVLKHRRQTLYTDSLNYDRLYKYAYFFDGGKLVDGKDQLSSDWGEYNTESKEAKFYYQVRLKSGKNNVSTDTLYYDTKRSMAHFTGKTTIVNNCDVVNTTNGYFYTKSDEVQLFSRSIVISKDKTIVGDTLFRDKKSGDARGFGRVIYTDTKNKNQLLGDEFYYNELTGKGYATKRALLKDYSQGDTLFVHADSLKLETFNINTDSVYRKVQGFNHVVAFRNDVQGICDSILVNSKDSSLTMFQDPVLWNENRQVLGEVIHIYMNDSTVRMAKVDGQALSLEQLDDKEKFNQVASNTMDAFFNNGALRNLVCTSNVRVIFFPINDADSTIIGLNYIETDTMRMYIGANKKLEKIWMPKAQGTLYPLNQVPSDRKQLPNFVWLEHLRPKRKEDVFIWIGKSSDEKLKTVRRNR